jgi:hypothetical protein
LRVAKLHEEGKSIEEIKKNHRQRIWDYQRKAGQNIIGAWYVLNISKTKLLLEKKLDDDPPRDILPFLIVLAFA